MKPLRLEFQAFGSYPGKEVVDFTVLARRGLFVVTGPTGTGKSTIFDAMVFALYGELPGSRSGMSTGARSHHADLASETYVVFDFEATGKHFRVTRKPAQERVKQRGSGTTTRAAEATLVEIVGASVVSLATKMHNVTEACEGVVGLDASQFQRVVLLPQGAFTAFLLAREADREALLRPLFGGEVYEAATQWLRGEMNRLDDMVRASDTQVRHHRMNAAAALVSATAAWLHEDVEPNDLVEADDAALRKRIDELAGERAGRRAALEQVEARATQASGSATTAEAAATLYDKAARTRARLVVMKTEQAGVDAERAQSEASRRARPVVTASGRMRNATEAAVAAQAGQDTLVAFVSGGFGEMGRPAPNATAQAISTAVTKAAQELRADQALLATVGKAREVLVAAEAVLARETAALETAKAALTTGQVEVDARQAKVVGLEPIAAGAPIRKVEAVAAQRALDERQKLETARNDLVTAQAGETAVQANYEAVMARFVETQASRLAERLEDNCPCPVCGSTEHPAPAQFGDGEPVDHVAVDTARARWSVEQGRVAEARRDVANLEALLGERASQNVAVLKEAQAAAGAALGEAQRAEVALVAERSQLVAAQERLAHARQQAVDCGTARAVAASDVEAKRAGLHAAQAACAHIDPTALTLRIAVVEGLEQTLASVDQVFASVTSTQAQLALEMSTLDGALEASGHASVGEAANACLDAQEELRLVQKVRAWDQEFASLSAHLRAYEEQGIPERRPDAEALRAVAVEEHDRAKAAASAFTTASNALKAAEDELAAAHAVGAGSAADRQKRDTARKVFKTCNGEAGLRVKLERWVLARELERVTMAANVHLGRMSSGRYRLERDNTQGGLKLEVHDVHTGRGRATNSLSGGEQFQASLSLALGLADVVSHGGSGSGKQFEALFVDEGFGSLDQDALGDAIDALEMIQASGRMVGALTHVEEMKNRLHKGIEVTRLPGGGGSTLSVYP